MQGAKRVVKTAVAQGVQPAPHFRKEKGVVGKGFRIINVVFGQNDVEVAAENHRTVKFPQICGMAEKSVHPFQFVEIFGTVGNIVVGRVAVGQIN